VLQPLAEHGIAQDTYVHVLPSTRRGATSKLEDTWGALIML
jgi:hypothetical protein